MPSLLCIACSFLILRTAGCGVEGAGIESAVVERLIAVVDIAVVLAEIGGGSIGARTWDEVLHGFVLEFCYAFFFVEEPFAVADGFGVGVVATIRDGVDVSIGARTRYFFFCRYVSCTELEETLGGLGVEKCSPCAPVF